MRSMVVRVIAVSLFILPGGLLCEAGALQKNNSANIEEADRLGEDFQKLGPWSRREAQGNGFYGLPQPGDYLATPESQLPQDAGGSDISRYPLCYNSYTGSYEYCYPEGSSFFAPGLRSRPWQRRGRACPPGYYFMPQGGCYRK